jgi:predicted RND superfamily exporter protein
MAGESSSLTVRISNWLIRWRWVLFVVSLAVTAAGFWPSRQLLFDAAITNLFPPDDPVLVAYQRSLRVFGDAELILVAYTDPDLLTSEGLDRLKQFAETFKDLDHLGVTAVASLADARWPLEPLDARRLVEQVAERDLSREQLEDTLLKSELYRNVLLGDDAKTTAISLRIRPKRNDQERKDLIAAIRARAAKNSLPTVVAGGPMLTHDASVFVDEDSRTLGWVSTGALLVVLGILFRKFRWIVMPLAVVHITLVWTKALLWVFEAQLSMVSSTLTALVTVVGVASVVQVTARYREEREKAEVRDALLRTMTAAGPAVFWASLTTAAGFSSLLITSIVPVHNFALMLATASMLVFVTTAALVPAVVLFGRRPSDPGAAPGERLIEHVLEATMNWSLRRPWQVSIVVLALLAVTVAGIFRIRAETDFTRNFRRSSEVVAAYNFVEQRLGAAGTLAIEFEVPESAHPIRSGPDGKPDPQSLTPEFVDSIRELENKLRNDPDHPALKKVLGIADVLDFFETGATGSASQLLGAMMGEQARLDVKLKGVRDRVPQAISTFWKEDTRQMRLILLAREQEPSEVKNELLAWIDRTAHEVLDQPDAPATIQVTGVYTLLNHLVSGLMSDQLNTLLLATASVFAIMCIALRSIRLAIVGLVPKIGPILMVLGAMGWLDVPIDMGTPMIASVSVGISVGFSIHYLYRFRQERAAGVPFDQALRATHRRVGGAMVFSNLALVVGFAVLALSNFIPTVHFSILAAVALIGGLAGNLLVLPLLLRFVSR